MPLITVHMCIVARGCKVFEWSKEVSGRVCWVWVRVNQGLLALGHYGQRYGQGGRIVRSEPDLICRFVTEATCGYGPLGHHGIKASFGLRYVARASCTGHCGTKANRLISRTTSRHGGKFRIIVAGVIIVSLSSLLSFVAGVHRWCHRGVIVVIVVICCRCTSLVSSSSHCPLSVGTKASFGQKG